MPSATQRTRRNVWLVAGCIATGLILVFALFFIVTLLWGRFGV